MDLHHLSVLDLRDVLGDLPHDTKRARVHDQYAPTLEALRAEVRADAPTLALYRGITRFLLDDTTDFTGSRSALQRERRRRAYGVIQRSRAWGDLIAEHHPRAVRLSIHPQPIGAAKFGMRLLDAPDAWTTPGTRPPYAIPTAGGRSCRGRGRSGSAAWSTGTADRATSRGAEIRAPKSCVACVTLAHWLR